ncbi:MAG: MaoC family dehydratase [Hydrogenophaga sp.]|nr:MaoC family dehydratase [Hydrogenophaga sp.]
MKRFETMAELTACIGQEVAVSDWITITQAQVDQFAARHGPFGATIAHGFLTLSLLPRFFDLAMGFPPVRMGINYGLNKVRFPSPVPVGSRVRARLTLLSSEPVDGDGVQLTWQVLVEREGGDKPVCVAESLARHYA